MKPAQLEGLTSDDIGRGVELMERQGGGFASALAAAYWRADEVNRDRILNAFADLFDRWVREANSERWKERAQG